MRTATTRLRTLGPYNIAGIGVAIPIDMNTKHTNRETHTGRYANKLDVPCTCGHTLGQHTAASCKIDGKKFQECCEDDCDCQCFKKVRKTRKS